MPESTEGVFEVVESAINEGVIVEKTLKSGNLECTVRT